MFDIDLLVKDIRLLWVALGNRSDDDLFITHRDKKSFEQSAWRISIGSRDNVNAELQVGLPLCSKKTSPFRARMNCVIRKTIRLGGRRPPRP